MVVVTFRCAKQTKKLATIFVKVVWNRKLFDNPGRWSIGSPCTRHGRYICSYLRRPTSKCDHFGTFRSSSRRLQVTLHNKSDKYALQMNGDKSYLFIYLFVCFICLLVVYICYFCSLKF